MTVIRVTDREDNQLEVDAYDGSTLMEVLRDEGTGVAAVCGGQCACATCHCYVEEGWFEKVGVPGEDELDLLSSLDNFDGRRSRLTCQIVVTEELDGMALAIAPEE